MSNTNSSIVFKSHPQRKTFKDLTNQKFGRYTVLGYAGGENRITFWYCRCDCGTVRKVRSPQLINGTSKSCGCLHNDEFGKRVRKHGHASKHKPTAEYRAFLDAKYRCSRPTHQSYKDYGGRGIKFLFTSFDEFLAEIGQKPTPQHSLDRIDNNGNYEKGNIQWAIKAKQLRNTRKTTMISFDGVTKSISDWSECQNIPKYTIAYRLKTGWCVPCALTIKDKNQCPHKNKTS